MVIPLLTRSVSDLLYGYSLSSAYRNAWVYDPDFSLSKDPDIWEIVRRDPIIMSAMDRRERGVVKAWHIEAPRQAKDDRDKRIAGICEDGIGRIHRFNAARRRLAEAHFIGRTYGYIEGEWRIASLDNGPEMEWWLPLLIRDIDRRRFHWVAKTEGVGDVARRKLHLEMYNDVTYRWVEVTPEFRQAIIEYVYGDTEDRVGYGRGLLEATYFYHYLKTVTLEKVAQGIDRWANGVLIGEIDSLRAASTGKTNTDLKNGMKTMLQAMRSEHVVVKQEGDKIELIETSGTGHQIGMDFIRYLDEGIERLYNGSIMPSGHASEAGSKARAETEADTTESFYQDDREDMDDILNRDLLGLFWKMNRKNFGLLGLLEAKRPVFHTRQERKEDPRQAADVMGSALDRGIPVLEREYYERLGMSVPGPEDKVVTGRKPSPFGNGFGETPFEGVEQESTDPDEDKTGNSGAPKRKGLPVAESRFEKEAQVRFDGLSRDIGALRELMTLGAQRQPNINLALTVPDQVMANFPTPKVDVHVPAPVIHYAPPPIPAPIINFQAPSASAPVVQVDVHVPQQAAPVVNVSPRFEVPVPSVTFHAPKPEPKRVEFERDAQGKIKKADILPQ